jgi:hypothetical protein
LTLDVPPLERWEEPMKWLTRLLGWAHVFLLNLSSDVPGMLRLALAWYALWRSLLP